MSAAPPTPERASPEALRAAACRVIARLLLGDADVDPALGDISLRPHQRDAVARVRGALARFGGALLADDVGLGKTYVALAAARDAARPLVVCPAGLRAMWRDAMARARVAAPLTTFESLSRGRAPDASPDLVIVDEAHHARNAAARRHAVLARLCAHARVLLLTATPLHNRRTELVTLLALFLGERARGLTDADLAEVVVRRRHRDVLGEAPAVGTPRWLAVGSADGVLDAILALPPALPPSGGGEGGALVAHGLVRQWASSDGALRAALRRRLARAAALEAALDAGRYPTARELSAWAYEDDAVQLAFPELLVDPPADAATGPLLVVLRAHADAVRALLRGLDDSRADDERAARLREVRLAHPGAKVVAFSCFAETVAALFRRMRADRGVAALTAEGALVAGGPLARDDALSRFAPRAFGVRPPIEAERIDLLLATDLLSEGVSLQDASVVVHLDLPWTPARLQQRVGRAARIGSAHAEVAVYALRPPASAEAVVRAERLLGEKLRAAARAVGVAGAILPGLAPPDDGRGAPEHAESLRGRLSAWRDASVPEVAAAEAAPLVAAARAPIAGFLAACVDEDGPRLLASVGASAAISEAPEQVALAAALAADGPACAPDPGALRDALDALERWRAHRQVERLTGLEGVGGATLRRRLLGRIARVARRAPPHLRPAAARLAADARRVAATVCGSGAERVLAELAGAEMADEAWLRAVGAFAAVHAPRDAAGDAWRVASVVLLQASFPACPASPPFSSTSTAPSSTPSS
jgi:hypothetical protein